MSSIIYEGVKSNLLSLYPGNCTGKVLSKFNRGLNIIFDQYLIYVGTAGTPLSSFGLNIDKGKLSQLLSFVKKDDIVINKENKLIFYSICGVLEIDVEDFKEVDLRLPETGYSFGKIFDNALYKHLEHIEFNKYIGITADEETDKHINLLLKSDKSDFSMNCRIIRYFTGRGKGLTPSGDDIIIGFTLALKTFGKFDAWLKALEKEVTEDRTTVISTAYLKALLKGYAGENFINVVKLLESSDKIEIEKTINEVRAFGHTSGNDTLFGFLLGLQFLANDKS